MYNFFSLMQQAEELDVQLQIRANQTLHYWASKQWKIAYINELIKLLKENLSQNKAEALLIYLSKTEEHPLKKERNLFLKLMFFVGATTEYNEFTDSYSKARGILEEYLELKLPPPKGDCYHRYAEAAWQSGKSKITHPIELTLQTRIPDKLESCLASES